MNTLTRAQFKALSYLAQATSENTVATVADSIGMSLADTDALLKELTALGYIADLFAVTEAGHEALEPYRARRVIFLAAGLGSRLRPATLNVPKPLVRVHGKPIICSAIEAALAKGIEEIYIVRGYLGGAFDQLKQMYPQIHLIDNPVYTQTNNVSSAMQVRHLFQHAYVMEADLLINNPDVFRKYNYTSNCVGVPVKKT
ncbi:MAG: NTP transferase domain-containing protein, partial [Clostridia bacterium]|nr:NTP transferase domain-containing protein [Clostridia bacterium]